METTPEMNAEIVAILRTSDEVRCQYAAMRIEDLEALAITLYALIVAPDAVSDDDETAALDAASELSEPGSSTEAHG